MNPIAYVRKNGIKRCFQVLYRYKLEAAMTRFFLLFTRHRPLKDMIVIESHNDFDCNGGAFYDYLLRNGYNRQYQIIWLLKNRIPKQLPPNVRAFPLYGPSVRKAYCLTRAKYLTADNVVTPKVRADQMSFFFDHGSVALKSVKGFSDLPKELDYVLSPSPRYDRVLARQYNMEYPSERFLYTGYPCHDVLYHSCPSGLERITTRRYSKVFLWMPTFRKGGGFHRNDSTAVQPFGIPLIDTDEDYARLQAFLAEKDCLLIIKIHPMQDPDTLTRLHDTDNIRVLTGQTVKELNIDNYRLFKCADGFISDYSSAAFSYLLLNRPLAFVLSDLEAYKLGFAMDDPEDFMVGHKIFRFADLLRFLSDVTGGVDPYRSEREWLANWLYKYRDGNSCQRIVEVMGLKQP